jgi:hypothetical protein
MPSFALALNVKKVVRTYDRCNYIHQLTVRVVLGAFDSWASFPSVPFQTTLDQFENPFENPFEPVLERTHEPPLQQPALRSSRHSLGPSATATPEQISPGSSVISRRGEASAVVQSQSSSTANSSNASGRPQRPRRPPQAIEPMPAPPRPKKTSNSFVPRVPGKPVDEDKAPAARTAFFKLLRAAAECSWCISAKPTLQCSLCARVMCFALDSDVGCVDALSLGQALVQKEIIDFQCAQCYLDGSKAIPVCI